MSIAVRPSQRGFEVVGEPTWDVARLFPVQGTWSVSNYLALTDHTQQFVEFTDGVVKVLEMPTDAHQDVLDFIYMAVRQFLSSRGGRVRGPVLRLKIADREFREPDLLVKLDGQVLPGEARYWTRADVVVEIVSEGDEARQRDYVEKREAYARGRVPEYWIVDPEKELITVLSLAPDGTYHPHGEFTPGQAMTSPLMTGFNMDVTAVFASTKD
jgi:Uma2 family endonuclease